MLARMTNPRMIKSSVDFENLDAAFLDFAGLSASCAAESLLTCLSSAGGL